MYCVFKRCTPIPYDRAVQAQLARAVTRWLPRADASDIIRDHRAASRQRKKEGAVPGIAQSGLAAHAVGQHDRHRQPDAQGSCTLKLLQGESHLKARLPFRSCSFSTTLYVIGLVLPDLLVVLLGAAVLVSIFERLHNPITLGIISCVCRAWRDVAKAPHLWAPHLEEMRSNINRDVHLQAPLDEVFVVQRE